VADLLSKDDDIELALAFGSVAAGQSRPDSDFDVAILTRGGDRRTT
jgi:predicted nucleotidyltransferase